MRSNNGIKCKQFVITLILHNLHQGIRQPKTFNLLCLFLYIYSLCARVFYSCSFVRSFFFSFSLGCLRPVSLECMRGSFSLLFSVSFDGRVWFVIVFRQKSFLLFLLPLLGGRRRTSGEGYIYIYAFPLFYIWFLFVFVSFVQVKNFIRMLLFWSAVALFKNFSSLVFLSLALAPASTFFLFYSSFVFFSSLFGLCVRLVQRNLIMFRLTYFMFKLSVNPKIWNELQQQ